MSIATAHVMYDEKRKMTIGYSGRITRKGNWLDVIFISDEPSNEKKKGKFNFFKINTFFFLFLNRK
jgi:hypothetical protein